jgi:hypothetical protein
MAFQRGNSITSITHRRRNLIMYSLQKHEVDSLKAGYTSPCLALFGLFAGAALTLWLTYWTVTVTESVSNKLFFSALSTSGLAVICLAFSIREWCAANRIIQTVMSETVEFVEEKPKPPL